MRLSPFALLDRWLAPVPVPGRAAWLGEWSYAHRGLHGPGAPENSPAAFAGAIARGMGIECDVQRTGDGRAVVFHDWELDRLTDEKGPVAARTAAVLERIPLRGSTDRIPSLGRLLDQVAGQVPLLIEIKSRGDRRAMALCLAVRRALEGYQGQHAVMSFDPRVARWFRHNSPHTVCGLVMREDARGETPRAWQRLAAYRIARPDFLAYHVAALPNAAVARLRRRGLPVLTWTVRSAEDGALAAAHADAPIAEGDGVA